MAIGIILAFVGVIVTSVSVTFAQYSDPVFLTDAPVGSWEIEAHYEKNDKILVYFNPPNPDMYPDPTPMIFVEVIDPFGKKAVFNVTFPESRPPEVSLVSNEGGLIVSDPPQELGGIVVYTGTYTANITTRRFWTPQGLELHRARASYPYRFVWPIGIAVIVAGCSLSVWGSRSVERKLKPRKRNSA